MWKKVICVAIVLVYIFALAAPAFADDGLLLTESMLQGLFWSISRQIGISGQNVNQLISDTTTGSVGLDDIVNGWKSWIGLTEIQNIWDDIKGDITDLGTVKYTTGRTVPSLKLRLTNNNVNSVKILSYSVQEYWKDRYNINSNSNVDWITIDEVFGGYLTYAENFTGTRIRLSASKDYAFGSYSDTSGFFSIGLDVYEILSEGVYRQLTHFDESNNTVTILSEPSMGTYFGSIGGNVYNYYYYPFTLSASGSISLKLDPTPITNSSYADIYWNTVAVMTLSDYMDWQSENLGAANADLFNFYYNSDIYVRQINGERQSSAILSAGDYVIVAALQYHGGSSSSRKLLLNTPYTVNGAFDLTIDTNSIYSANRIFGVGRTATWSVDITDSGTGTTTTMTDAISTYFPQVYDLDQEEPVIYFPSEITYVPELTDVLTTDYAITGEITAAPSTTWPEGVTIDLVPPASFNFGSIWHYVQETYDYVSLVIGQIITLWAFAVPPIIRSAAYSFVVIGIIFGIYRRLIE